MNWLWIAVLCANVGVVCSALNQFLFWRWMKLTQQRIRQLEDETWAVRQ